MRKRTDTPWQEVNSSQEGTYDVLRVVQRNQSLSLAQAVAIETALLDGFEVWATYVSPIIDHGVRVNNPSSDLAERLHRVGFEVDICGETHSPGRRRMILRREPLRCS